MHEQRMHDEARAFREIALTLGVDELWRDPNEVVDIVKRWKEEREAFLGLREQMAPDEESPI